MSQIEFFKIDNLDTPSSVVATGVNRGEYTVHTLKPDESIVGIYGQTSPTTRTVNKLGLVLLQTG
jgi:hypothetical protein